MKDADKALDKFLKEDETYLSHYEKENWILEPLLEEIDLIVDESIKSFTRSVLLRAGPFWEIPASFSGKHHPPDERGTGGNVLHTKRVVRTVGLICQSYNCTDIEKDILTSAALLHDLTKGILIDGLDETRYDPMHPYTVDRFVNFIRQDDETYATENQSSTLYIKDELVNQIMKCIRFHLGPWSPVPETRPLYPMEMILHIADYCASNLHYIIDGIDCVEERWLLPE